MIIDFFDHKYFKRSGEWIDYDKTIFMIDLSSKYTESIFRTYIRKPIKIYNGELTQRTLYPNRSDLITNDKMVLVQKRVSDCKFFLVDSTKSLEWLFYHSPDLKTKVTKFIENGDHKPLIHKFKWNGFMKDLMEIIKDDK